MENDFSKIVDEVLVDVDTLNERIRELGKDITQCYADVEEPVLLVGILRGAAIFMSSLAININKPVLIDFMAVSSYGQSSESSGVVRIMKDLEETIEGKHVLIVEDIIDTGLTLSYIRQNMIDRGAKSVRIATLLDKPERRKVEVPVDFVGFKIPDEFVIGYGLDYAQNYRNLPYIASLKREVYENN